MDYEIERALDAIDEDDDCQTAREDFEAMEREIQIIEAVEAARWEQIQ